jgi:hypothetical protein
VAAIDQQIKNNPQDLKQQTPRAEAYDVPNLVP